MIGYLIEKILEPGTLVVIIVWIALIPVVIWSWCDQKRKTPPLL